MILSVGLISIVAFFPLGLDMHNKSIQDEKSALIVESLKDAIVTACKYADFNGTDATITIVHDGFGVMVGGVPEGKTLPPIKLPADAKVKTKPGHPDEEIDDDINPNGTTPATGIQLKYDNNDGPYKVRLPDQLGQSVYPVGLLLRKTGNLKYFNKWDDLPQYSFDIEIREAITTRRPIDPATGKEHTNYLTKICRLASQQRDKSNALISKHDEYEFTIRVYRNWVPRTSADAAAGRENRHLVRVYTFVTSIIR
jgi:hypothetical protein